MIVAKISVSIIAIKISMNIIAIKVLQMNDTAVALLIANLINVILIQI